ncbi:hypothetical protein [Methanospirillum purgamenti]|jgi:hypothetical protein|uniref:Uncharacterized protein n=1 Tax=Methanospirillum hungatei TaxID=2203 RepID=A0A8F5VKN3_METHU|nr:hypothetical protein [Methanospirillum hungatei]QXO94787.1 hypothetical protein KSK55_16005 [Methanospirillum hungatei]
MTEIKTINQIRDEGLAALIKALGPGNAIRYINSFEQGTGNYSEEKYQNMDEEFDAVVARIKNRTEPK